MIIDFDLFDEILQDRLGRAANVIDFCTKHACLIKKGRDVSSLIGDVSFWLIHWHS